MDVLNWNKLIVNSYLLFLSFYSKNPEKIITDSKKKKKKIIILFYQINAALVSMRDFFQVLMIPNLLNGSV